MDERIRIFLSGTRRDLGSFYPPARKALEDAFPEFEIIAMEEAEPEDVPGDHWSRREATSPDVLVGLVGRYYGSVPSGQGRSLTEQEYDVAGQMGIERLMFVTELGDEAAIAAQDPEQQRRIQAFRAKIDQDVVRRNVLSPEEFAEHAVKAVQQWERRTLRGATQTAAVYFAPLLNPDALFNHAEPLVGQRQVLAQLEAFATSERRMLVLHAPWGRGKSRLLREFAETAAVRVRFLREDDTITRRQLDVSAVDPVVLVIDDVQFRKDEAVRQLLAFLQRCEPEVKLVVAARSSRLDRLTAALRARGFAMSSVDVVELPSLSEAEQRQLIARILGRDDELTQALAVRTRGSVLSALLGARLIRRGQAVYADLDQNPDFVAEVLGRFQDAVLTAPGIDEATRGRLRDLLQVLALCAPVRPGDSSQRDALAAFLGQSPETIIRDIGLLEDLGLLLRRGGLVTIPVDAIRENEALRACVDTRGQSTGRAERALRELSGVFRRHLLRTLARVDWQTERAGETVSLLDRIWPDLEAIYDSMPLTLRVRLCQDLEDVAPFRPSAAIRFVQHALPSGLGPPETHPLARFLVPRLSRIHDALTRILRGTFYDPESIEPACDLLWMMARDDDRAPGGAMDSAERALRDLAKLTPHRPIACYEAFLRWAEHQVRSVQVPGHRIATYLEQMLEKEVEVLWSDERSVHWGTRGAPVDRVRPLHERALQTLDLLGQQGEMRTIARSVQAIGSAINPPSGTFNREVGEAELKAWEPLQLEAVERLRQISVHHDRRTVDLCVLGAVDRVARYARQAAIKEAAARVTRELRRQVANTIEAALLPPWAPPWEDDTKDEEAERTTGVASIAEYWLTQGATLDELIERIAAAHVELQAAGLQAHAGMLLACIAERRPEFVRTLLDRLVDLGDPPMAGDAQAALCVAVLADPGAGVQAIETALARGGRNLHCAVARGYAGQDWRSAVREETTLRHMRDLLSSNDLATRLEALRSLWLAKELSAGRRIELLIDYDPRSDGERSDHWLMALDDLYDHLTFEQRQRLLEKLEQRSELEYFAQQLLTKLTRDEPTGVVDMLLARVDASLKEYQAVPEDRHGDCLAALPDAERERALLALGPRLDHEEPGIRQAARKMFSRLGLSSPDISRAVRTRWASEGTSETVLRAAQSFRDEPPNVLFDEESTVVAILRAAQACGATALRDVESELLIVANNAVRTRGFSEAAPLDEQIRSRAQEIASRYQAGSVEARFYKRLQKNIETSISEDLQRDEESTLPE